MAPDKARELMPQASWSQHIMLDATCTMCHTHTTEECSCFSQRKGSDQMSVEKFRENFTCP